MKRCPPSPSARSAPTRGRGWWTVVLLALVLLPLSVWGCATEEVGEGEAGEQVGLEADDQAEESGLGEAISEAELQGEELAENPATFISLCVNCHDELDRELDWRRERKLIFDHQVHFANNIRCAACHHEFPHKQGYTIYVDVETCFLCHGRMHGPQGQLAPTDCDVCHTSDIDRITPDHEASNWVFATGSERAEHSQQALDRRMYCRMCHGDQFCLDCHGIDMPHPDDWLGVSHPQVEPEERQTCSTCHTDSSFCNECHHVAYQDVPDWRSDHNTVVRSEGASSCYECHSVISCEECHVRTSAERGVWND